jgi:two-component system, chemotaxis family, chemotaxis protein CheY
MKTILVVDDFQTTRKVIINALTKFGYKTVEAGDGAEALSLLDGRTIDLVITDFNMPQMDGADLIGCMRKLPAYTYIPALVLSTEVKEDKKAKAESAKITAWVQKPFDLEKFIKVVQKAIQ